MDNDPIYVYDSRTQFVRPMFVVYQYELIDPFLKKMGIDEGGSSWKRPDWVIVTKQRMHPHSPDPYKVPGASRNRVTTWPTKAQQLGKSNSLLIEKNRELSKSLAEFQQRAVEAETKLEAWKADNMAAVRDLAVEILTKKG